MLKNLLAASCFVLLGASVALAAPSPHNGTFHIVRAKSDWSDGKLPPNMSLTLNITIDGDHITYHAVNDTIKDKLYIVDWQAKMDGQPYPFDGGARFNQVSVKRLGDDEYQVLKMKDGDVIAGEYWRYFPGNKVMIKRGIAKPDAGGRSKAYVEYFERQ